MKIGVFDSGLGGLLILRAMKKKLPEYDYIYLGDTERVPYGNRSEETVYRFLEQAVDYLFRQDCALIILACNTASAEALRKIQQQYLPGNYPDRRVLGVIIPTAEEAVKTGNIRRIGVLATQGTVGSGAYVREIKKLDRRVKVLQSPAPLLVPLIENGGTKWSEPILKEYLRPLIRGRAETIILGCTHYPALKSRIRRMSRVKVVSQDEFLPGKLKGYLQRHMEIDERLSKKRSVKLFATDITPHMEALARKWFGADIRLTKISLADGILK